MIDFVAVGGLCDDFMTMVTSDGEDWSEELENNMPYTCDEECLVMIMYECERTYLNHI